MQSTLVSFALALGICAAPAVAQDRSDLAAPVRLKAGGEFIDAGEYVAHAGPLFADYDNDGNRDLLVGNFRGHIQLFRNVGTETSPEFESAGLLQTEGEDIRIHNW